MRSAVAMPIQYFVRRHTCNALCVRAAICTTCYPRLTHSVTCLHGGGACPLTPRETCQYYCASSRNKNMWRSVSSFCCQVTVCVCGIGHVTQKPQYVYMHMEME